MSVQSGTAIGFIQQFIFPFAAWFLVIVEYSRNFAIPLTAIVAIYPIGFLFLVVYSIVLTPRTLGGPENWLPIIRGSRLGIMATVFISLPAFFILADLLGARQIAYGFLAVAAGSLWLPASAAAKLYGYILVDGKESRKFLERASKSPVNFEALSSFFLTIFLGKFAIAKNLSRIVGVLAMVGLFVGGWILLGISGGSYAALFGLFAGLLIPVSSGASFVGTLAPESRRKVSEILAKHVPTHTEFASSG
jgi:hypothetical protein